MAQSTEQYHKVLAQWQQVEATKKEIELQAACNGHRVGSVSSREGSPALSLVSTSPVHSPEDANELHDESHDLSHDRPHDRLHERSHDRSRERSCERVDDVSNGLSHDSHLINGPSSQEVAESHAKAENDNKKLAIVSDDQDHQSHDETQLSHDTTHLAPDESPLVNGHMSDRGEDLDGSTTHSDIFPPDPEEVVMGSTRLDSQGREFVKNLYNIDKDIPRCDRDYE